MALRNYNCYKNRSLKKMFYLLSLFTTFYNINYSFYRIYEPDFVSTYTISKKVELFIGGGMI
jgi:hypothetical protein